MDSQRDQGSKARTRLTVLAVFSLLIAFSYFYYAHRGQRELGRTIVALETVRSYHYGTRETDYLRGGVEVDVVCPSDHRRESYLFGRVAQVQIQVGDTQYFESRPNDWSVAKESPLKYCGSVLRIEGRSLLETLRFLGRNARIKKGAQKFIHGVTCQVYFSDLTYRPDGAVRIPSEICIEEKTHYPMEFREDGYITDFSKWNAVEPIELPDITKSQLDTPYR
jgi:hypothetical protein